LTVGSGQGPGSGIIGGKHLRESTVNIDTSKKGATCLAGVQTFLTEKGNQRDVSLMDDYYQEMGIINGNCTQITFCLRKRKSIKI